MLIISIINLQVLKLVFVTVKLFEIYWLFIEFLNKIVLIS